MKGFKIGQRVKSFSLNCMTRILVLYTVITYTTIGHQRILSFPTKTINRIIEFDSRRKAKAANAVLLRSFSYSGKIVEQ